ncbi:MAG TPA: hypothetical protein VFZ61_18250 [Polyangiales bacterium]
MSREPISWLLLERYALDELGPEERADVEARLAQSEADRACLAQIRADTSQLPPLSLPAEPRAAAGARPAAAVRARPKARVMAFAGALCAAALALIAVLKPRPTEPGPTPTTPAAVPDDNVKGEGMFLHLLSDRQGPSPRMFTSGERFKLEISCPPRLGGSLRLFVFQGEEVFEPLPLSAPLTCGNLVPWPGAFVLTGSDPADVCVSWARELGDVRSVEDLGSDSSCTRLNTP